MARQREKAASESWLSIQRMESEVPKGERPRRKRYELELMRLQIEMLKLQLWVKEEQKSIVILFEGRDAAGKGGAIRRFTEHVNPRGARVVALPAPTDVERSQWYLQRYVTHLPAGGEIVFFDRSWYNRAGVERVMGYATEKQVALFFEQVPDFERQIGVSRHGEKIP
jgi:polyphosphate kinase 2 (PPK2 family)